jgi:hypothetical protein
LMSNRLSYRMEYTPIGSYLLATPGNDTSLSGRSTGGAGSFATGTLTKN